ncbi:hypothetical protein BB561_005676 [Smittium simulii]|uniref:Uncharacterized protein n=1 Tax=Smittium simulii TaxID=133385 RepID=A0A2T9Y946_9FUNG|nr:hypothetical protein BB561_005676 [Smittium simulii]
MLKNGLIGFCNYFLDLYLLFAITVQVVGIYHSFQKNLFYGILSTSLPLSVFIAIFKAYLFFFKLYNDFGWLSYRALGANGLMRKSYFNQRALLGVSIVSFCTFFPTTFSNKFCRLSGTVMAINLSTINVGLRQQLNNIHIINRNAVDLEEIYTADKVVNIAQQNSVSKLSYSNLSKEDNHNSNYHSFFKQYQSIYQTSFNFPKMSKIDSNVSVPKTIYSHNVDASTPNVDNVIFSDSVVSKKLSIFQKPLQSNSLINESSDIISSSWLYNPTDDSNSSEYLNSQLTDSFVFQPNVQYSNSSANSLLKSKLDIIHKDNTTTILNNTTVSNTDIEQIKKNSINKIALTDSELLLINGI